MKKRIAANSDIPLSKIHITDRFWNAYRDLVGKVIIPYQWDVLNDVQEDIETSHCIENFRIAAGEAEGEFYGMDFQDTDLVKWLEAVGFYLAAQGRDEKLEALADEAIALIGRAQQPDGYLDTYFTVKEPGMRWQNLEEGHELYTAGHMIEAAVAYYEGTGKRAFLEIVMRLADLLCRTFGAEEGKIHGYPGHPEVEQALVKLYRTTGERRYLELAKYFIDARGVGENYFLQEEKRPGFKRIFPELRGFDPAYSQSHMPVRKQKTAEGHAVRAGYLYSGMCDVALEYQDAELLESCRTLWDNMVHKRMYITGGIGSSGILERFTTDFDLPNNINYSESCASIALAMFGKRLAKAAGDASCMDEVERALYNTVLSGIGLDGRQFFYVNPMEVWPAACMSNTSLEHVKPRRQKWFGVACCPPNIARTLASVGQYMFFLSEDRLSVNLYLSSETEFDLAGIPFRMKMESELPWNGNVTVRLTARGGDPAGKAAQIAFRIPWYARDFTVSVDGAQPVQWTENGYMTIPVDKQETVFEIRFGMPPVFICANPEVRADAGRVAMMKGPLVYCLEQADNGENLAALTIDTSVPLQEEYRDDLFKGTIVLKAAGTRRTSAPHKELYIRQQDMHTTYEKTQITAIPYCFWGNRRPGEEMQVWTLAGGA